MGLRDTACMHDMASRFAEEAAAAPQDLIYLAIGEITLYK